MLEASAEASSKARKASANGERRPSPKPFDKFTNPFLQNEYPWLKEKAACGDLNEAAIGAVSPADDVLKTPQLLAESSPQREENRLDFKPILKSLQMISPIQERPQSPPAVNIKIPKLKPKIISADDINLIEDVKHIDSNLGGTASNDQFLASEEIDKDEFFSDL